MRRSDTRLKEHGELNLLRTPYFFIFLFRSIICSKSFIYQILKIFMEMHTPYSACKPSSQILDLSIHFLSRKGIKHQILSAIHFLNLSFSLYDFDFRFSLLIAMSYLKFSIPSDPFHRCFNLKYCSQFANHHLISQISLNTRPCQLCKCSSPQNSDCKLSSQILNLS